MSIYKFTVGLIITMMFPIMAHAGPGCSAGDDQESGDIVGFTVDVLEAEKHKNSKADFIIEVPVCVSDVPEDVERIDIECAAMDKVERDYRTHGNNNKIYEREGKAGTFADIDEVAVIEIKLKKGQHKSSVGEVKCNLSFIINSVGYSQDVKRTFCKPQAEYPDVCPKTGSRLSDNLTHTIDDKQ